MSSLGDLSPPLNAPLRDDKMDGKVTKTIIRRHCERSEAIQGHNLYTLDCFTSFAMTGNRV